MDEIQNVIDLCTKAFCLVKPWDVLISLAESHLRENKNLASIKYAEAALKMQPDSLRARVVLCSAYERFSGMGKMIFDCAKAGLEIDPGHIDLLLRAGHAKLSMMELQEASVYFQRALAENPDNISAILGLFETSHTLGDLNQSGSLLEKALSLNPTNPWASNAKAIFLKDLGKYSESFALAKKLVEEHPNIRLFKFNLSSHYLLQGDLRKGFELYEYRPTNSWERMFLDLPCARLWKGEELEGKSIFLWSDQGDGDTIQFMRYIPLFSAYKCKVFLKIPDRMHGLFQHLKVYLVQENEKLPAHDFQLSLSSLPALFKTKLAIIPPPVSFPKTLQPIKGRIGIVWRGNPNYKWDKKRSIDLEFLTPLFQIEGVKYIALQKEINEKEIRFLDKHGILRPKLETWEDTAQNLQFCERVICVDTAIAHLAGSMGISTSILISLNPDWRWMLDREDSPWYASIRLFRQRIPFNWKEPIEEIVRSFA